MAPLTNLNTLVPAIKALGLANNPTAPAMALPMKGIIPHKNCN
jgi:hypothetical protein